MSEPSSPSRNRELALVVVSLLIAAFFRLYRLADVPPGLHHDDVKNVVLSRRVQHGYLAVYYPENYGHEPLYHWLQAGVLAVVGDRYPEVRLLSVGIGLLGLVAIYVFTRRLLGTGVALWTLAWQAVSLWPLFYSRRCIRGILLPPLVALAGYFFWRGLQAEQRGRFFGPDLGWFTLAGGFMAAGLYTYAGGRVLPLVFGLQVLCLGLIRRYPRPFPWKGVALFFVVTALLTAPLAHYLLTHPEVETRLTQINAPLAALDEGNPRPLLQNSLRELGMFTFLGTPHWREFVANRPVFSSLGGLLFYLGIVVALRHALSMFVGLPTLYRGAGALFVLLWLPVALTPAMVSAGAPNFLRPIAVLTVVYAFPSLAMDALWRWSRGRGRLVSVGMLSLFLGLLLSTAYSTYHSYFRDWAGHPDVRFTYNTTLLDMARYLDHSSETTPVAITGHHPADLDPATLSVMLRRNDLALRCYDSRQAIVFPGGQALVMGGEIRYLVPLGWPLDPILEKRFWSSGKEEQLGLDGRPSSFYLCRLPYETWRSYLDGLTTASLGLSPATTFPDGLPSDLRPLSPPVDLAGLVALRGYELVAPTAAPGETVTLLTSWEIQRSPKSDSGDRYPLKIFVHLLAPAGTVVAGRDTLGYPTTGWQKGDCFVQVHHLTLDANVPPGLYPLEIGIYDPETMSRLPVRVAGQDLADRLLLGPVEVR